MKLENKSRKESLIWSNLGPLINWTNECPFDCRIQKSYLVKRHFIRVWEGETSKFGCMVNGADPYISKEHVEHNVLFRQKVKYRSNF